MARAVFAGVTNVTEVTSAAAQTQIIARVNLVKALIVDGIANPSGVKTPDFDTISPALADQLRAEFDALTAAIDAAPTA